MLFDTDIFIWAQRGNAGAAKLLNQASLRLISAISWMEFLQGARSAAEFRLSKKFLLDLGFETVPVTEETSHRAMVYIEQFALSHGVTATDALIAATAVELQVPLATSNSKHFKAIPSLELKAFNPR
jgi:predicted nucleic acid-binding protein